MRNQKFDLSNVGGQPKGWAQREHEKRLEPGLALRTWALIGFVSASLLIGIYGVFSLLAWSLS